MPKSISTQHQLVVGEHRRRQDHDEPNDFPPFTSKTLVKYMRYLKTLAVLVLVVTSKCSLCYALDKSIAGVVISLCDATPGKSALELLSLAAGEKEHLHLVYAGGNPIRSTAVSCADLKIDQLKLFEQMVIENNEKPPALVVPDGAVVTVTIVYVNSPPISCAWKVQSDNPSVIPAGLTGHEALQELFDKLPISRSTRIRLLMNSTDMLHSGSVHQFPFTEKVDENDNQWCVPRFHRNTVLIWRAIRKRAVQMIVSRVVSSSSQTGYLHRVDGAKDRREVAS